MPALPAAAARQGMLRKKAARSCQSLELRNGIIVGSRKSLHALHGKKCWEVYQPRHVACYYVLHMSTPDGLICPSFIDVSKVGHSCDM